MAKRITSVAALLPHDYAPSVGLGPNNLILSISRKGDHQDKGLPGGKVDSDDKSPFSALCREVFEESGLVVLHAVPVFEREDHGFYNQTWFVLLWTGTISTSETGEVSWVYPRDLLAPHCTFREYNAALFRHMGLKV